MLPALWGNHMWFSIHFIAQDYPEQPSAEDMVIYKAFYENLGRVLPCYKCGVNYKRHLEELPIDQHLYSRESLFAWTVALHNIVNRELGKPEMSLAEAKKKYSDPDFNRKVCESQQVLQIMSPQSLSQHNDASVNNKHMLWGIGGIVIGAIIASLVIMIVRRHRSVR